VSSVFILIIQLTPCSFLSGLFSLLLFILLDAAVLNGAKNVLVVVLGDVGYDILGVLLGTESQVSELAALVGEEGSEGLLGLHDEVSHEGGVLDGGEAVTFFIRFGEHFDGDTIVVN